MIKSNIEDVFVSIILLAEDTGVEHTKAAIDNVLEQTHKNLEIVISTLFDDEELRAKYDNNWNIKFIKASKGIDFLKEAINETKGDIIFYKTVTNVLWFPRHIQAHLEEFKQQRKAKWALSHVEYRDLANPDHPLNTIGYRIENPPETVKIILDEIAHYKEVATNWGECVAQHEGENLFMAGLILKQWNEERLSGVIPSELTVVQWIPVDGDNQMSYEEMAKQLGTPVETEIKDENKFIDGNIEVVRTLPTVMGNSHLDEAYNNQMREAIKTTVDIKTIGIKRTIGLGDVILVEPIIKKLKEKHPEAIITLYTAKPDIVKYFKNKPHDVQTIEENQLLQDFLSTTQNQLKYDLDLSYESRLGTPFIEAYTAVCGIEWNDYKDKHPQLEGGDGGGVAKDRPYVVVVGDGSGWAGKSWGQENYKEVVQNIIDREFRVVEPGFEIFSGLTDDQHAKCDLNELVTIIRDCYFYIGTDNGPMHIARAFNKPCIIIAGAAIPYFSTPNREKIFYVQDNSLDCLGCKHKQFFSSQGSNNLTFVPTCTNETGVLCMQTIKPEHVIRAIDKFLDRPRSIFRPKTPTDFYFNIPGHSYYYDEGIDLIQRSDIEEHPDQVDDLHEQYSSRWEEVYEKYSKTFVEEVLKHRHAESQFKEGDKRTFLDVGCNIGLVVKAAEEAGFNAIGIDLNRSSILKGNELFSNLKLIEGDFMDRSTQPNVDNDWKELEYDIIACNQTLEHISDPVRFLKRCKEYMSDTGLMFIGIPSMDEEGARDKMHRFQTLGTGEHTWLPTNKSFEYLMKKVKLNYEHLQDTSKGIFVKAWKRT